MANATVVGTPTPIGNFWLVQVDHTGPASYNNTGTFATSGETLNATDLGFGGIVNVDGMVSNDGVNFIGVASPVGNPAPLASVALHWYTMNGTEVTNATNLSTKTVRLQILCV